MRTRWSVVAVAAAFVLILAPRHADGQWYGAAYLGVSHTTAADVSISQPALDTDVTFHDVEFRAESFKSPQYYGLRAGRLFGARGRFGLELELIHLKVISETGREYSTTGRIQGAPIEGPTVMAAFAERYAMTHGLNFVLVNAVGRWPLIGDRTSATARAGAGPVVPHTETTVGGEAVDRYEWAGVGLHAAAGIDVSLGRRVSATLEYKITSANPRIAVAGGTGQTRATSHHVAFGLAFGGGR